MACNGTVDGFVQAASDFVHKNFTYMKGATHVHSSVADSLTLRAGVCQDFAHLLIGAVRMRGLPARYVSGYLVSGSAGSGAKQEEVIGGQASHAWVEVFLPGQRLVLVSIQPWESPSNFVTFVLPMDATMATCLPCAASTKVARGKVFPSTFVFVPLSMKRVSNKSRNPASTRKTRKAPPRSFRSSTASSNAESFRSVFATQRLGLTDGHSTSCTDLHGAFEMKLFRAGSPLLRNCL